MIEVEPALFDRFDPDRCLVRTLLDGVASPVQCVLDAGVRVHRFEHPLDEPAARAEQRRLAGGDE